MPAFAIAEHDAKAERTYMDADMTRADLIAVLEDLRFSRRGEPLQVVSSIPRFRSTADVVADRIEDT